jgi:hypothetical protein
MLLNRERVFALTANTTTTGMMELLHQNKDSVSF